VREARREKGERNRKQRPNRREQKQKKRRNEAETGGIFGFPAAAPFSPQWPSATTIQHSHFTTTATPLVSNRQQRHRQPLTIFLPLLQHCEEEGKQQHWLAQPLCRDSTISVPLHRHNITAIQLPTTAATSSNRGETETKQRRRKNKKTEQNREVELKKKKRGE
jgi:hypothetical protein